MTRSRTAIGIDLGAAALHVVAVSSEPGATPRVARSTMLRAHALDDLCAFASGAGAIAIDAPSDPSTTPHAGDETLSRKFRTARCGEIALGEQAKIWVPWVTPADGDAIPTWMATGFATWAALRAAGHAPIEVYPAGAFRALAGQIPSKQTPEGILRRIDALAPHVALPDNIELWSHDGIDALAAALVAHWSIDGRARRITHDSAGCDGSAIWLPPVVLE